MKSDEARLKAIGLLQSKYEQINALPQKSDFSPEEVCLIKQSLGAWPRALEQANLKAASNHTRHLRTIEKRNAARLKSLNITGEDK